MAGEMLGGQGETDAAALEFGDPGLQCRLLGLRVGMGLEDDDEIAAGDLVQAGMAQEGIRQIDEGEAPAQAAVDAEGAQAAHQHLRIDVADAGAPVLAAGAGALMVGKLVAHQRLAAIEDGFPAQDRGRRVALRRGFGRRRRGRRFDDRSGRPGIGPGLLVAEEGPEDLQHAGRRLSGCADS